MKRSTGFQVRKRDGRMEWLRATKLAHSIGRAIAAGRTEEFGGHDLAGEESLAGEEWRTADLTTAILTGLREQYGPGTRLATIVLADAVQQVLLATGFPRAAEAYARAGGAQRRRRAAFRKTMPSLADGIPMTGLSGPQLVHDSGAAGPAPAAHSSGRRRGSGAGGRPARGGTV